MQNTDKSPITDRWLKANGINPQQLLAVDIELLQAQKIAHNLLKHHSRLLRQNQTTALNDFLTAMSFSSKRKRITKRTCYRIINIGTETNRKVFQQHRRLGR